jgi:hypothetical protein
MAILPHACVLPGSKAEAAICRPRYAGKGQAQANSDIVFHLTSLAPYVVSAPLTDKFLVFLLVMLTAALP